MSGDYNDYKRVDAKTIHAAVNGDDEAFMKICYRYKGYIVNLIVSTYINAGIEPNMIPYEDVLNAAWMEMKKCVMKFEPY